MIHRPSFFTFLFVYFLSSLNVAAQTPVWAKIVGGPSDDEGRVCKIASNGNIYLAGRFSGTVDLDPGSGVYNVSSNGSDDIFLACYTSSGNLVWGFGLGGSNYDAAVTASVDDSNNVIIGGYIQSNVDFDPSAATSIITYSGGSGQSYYGDGFIAKYSSSGVFQWAKGLGGSTVYDFVTNVAVDGAQNIYACGEFTDVMTVSPTTVWNSAVTGKAYIIKYDPSGNVVWANVFGLPGVAASDTYPHCMLIKGNRLYVSGVFQGSSFFDQNNPGGSTLIASGTYDAWLARYDTSGNYAFVKPITGAGNFEEALYIGADFQENIYITGYTNSSAVTFNTASAGTSTVVAPGGGGNNDIFLAKYDSLGTYQWAELFGSSATEMGYNIAVSDTCLYITGIFSNTVDFDASAGLGNVVSNGSTDAYLCKYDLNGNYLCGFGVGGVPSDGGRGLDIDTLGNIIVTGGFSGLNVDFDPDPQSVLNLSSNGLTDAFLAKYLWNNCNFLQPSQDTTINDYAAVLDYSPCNNFFTVDTATNFAMGDTVLVIQMKGAVIDTSNTANFGNILSYNGCGNYEYNIVQNVSGNVISLVYNLQRTYDIPDGKVQLVRVPYYQSYAVNQPHTCMPWNGSKGGVFAINVAGILTMNNDINVSEKGFMGGNGNPITTGTYYCNVSNYYVSSNIDSASNKGEGITTVSSYKMKGRGALANGGGGGNGHNGGGGGGSNGNTGGTGGYQYSFCPGANPANNTVGGIGGKTLNYSNTSNKVFMGGGGGAGQSNDGTATFGGNGGGIVLINANSLVGNNGSIVANGQDAPGCAFTGGPACHDGMGGGGGAGTVMLNVNAVTGNIPVVAKGGKGADMAGDIINGRVGPGGGGSGGVLWMKGGTVPASVVTALNGGANGVILYDGDSYGAQPGQPGTTVTGLQLSFPTDSFKTINYSLNDSFLACRTFLFTAVNNGSVAAAQFQWQFGDGTTGTGNPVSHTYATNGSYVVTLIVSDSVGCSDTITQTISVNGATADFTISNNSVCIGQPVTFSATPTGQSGASYSWNFDDGSVANGSQVTHAYSTAGTYAVTLYFTDSLGCNDTVSHTVSVDSVHADFTISNDTVCSGQTITFTSNATGPQPLTYNWFFGDGNIASTASATHAYNADGTYQVSLIVSSPDACADTVEKAIYVGNPAPDSLTATICADSSFLFGAQLIDTAGIYTQIFTSTNGCDSIVVLTVDMIPQPSVDFTSTTALNMPVTFTNTSSNATSFLWEFGDGSTSNDFSPVHQYTSGTHTVCLTGWNDEGCSEKVCKEIFTEIYTAIDVPLAFSPNGDGNNDVLYVRGGGVKEMTFRVYNRWGQTIFESHSLNEGWDGRFKGKLQDLETVAYVLQATFIDGTTVQKQGNVTILH